MRPSAWAILSLVAFVAIGALSLYVAAVVSSITGFGAVEREFVVLGHTLMWGVSAVPVTLLIGRSLGLTDSTGSRGAWIEALAGVVLASIVAAANVSYARDGGILDVDAIGLIGWLPAATLSVVVSTMAYRSATPTARPLWSVFVAATAASAVAITLFSFRDGVLGASLPVGAAAAASIYVVGASVRALRSS